MQLQGWYTDPTGRHEARYFSDGRPTELVRDRAAESSDPIAPGEPLVSAPQPVEVCGDDQQLPQQVFEGESFESQWGGSEGYGRATDGRAGENWMDRIIVAVVTPLSPSRFQEPGYWTRYVPVLLAVTLLLTLLIVLVVL
jgi:hypothetical protein